MELEEYNSFAIYEKNSIPPISDMGKPEFDESVDCENVKVEIFPIFGLPYQAILPKHEIMPLLAKLKTLNGLIAETEQAFRKQYYKKAEIPIVGRLLAAPIARKGDAALLALESKSRALHEAIIDAVRSHMTVEDTNEMIRSREEDYAAFSRKLRRMGYEVP